MEEREDLMELLIAVGGELHDMGEDPERGELVEMSRLLDDDTSEIANDARATIPRLHHLWCGTARRSHGDASDEDDGIAALIYGTQCRYVVASTCWAWHKTKPRRGGQGQGAVRD